LSGQHGVAGRAAAIQHERGASSWRVVRARDPGAAFLDLAVAAFAALPHAGLTTHPGKVSRPVNITGG
jgi:hypothetical protein